MWYQSTLLHLRTDLIGLKGHQIITRLMKKVIVASLAVLLSCGIVTAMEMPAATASSVSTTASSRVSIPTGVFFNGRNFVKVESTWVRICIGGQSQEYSIKHVEMDPSGNYALVLSNGGSITIYSNGRSLYYGGTTYSR